MKGDRMKRIIFYIRNLWMRLTAEKHQIVFKKPGETECRK